MDEEIIYLYTKVSYDEDNDALTGGKHIQVTCMCIFCFPSSLFKPYAMITDVVLTLNHFLKTASYIQVFMEDLQRRDAILQVPTDFIMVGRTSVMLRGLAHALHQSRSIAKAWKPIAERVLREETSKQVGT